MLIIYLIIISTYYSKLIDMTAQGLSRDVMRSNIIQCYLLYYLSLKFINKTKAVV